MDLKAIETILTKECGLTKGQPVLVGVSGGPDSLCLLHVMHTLGFCVYAAHVNHQLRQEADHEAEIVRQYCTDWNVPYVYQRVNVAAYAKEKKLSIEESARILRYTCLMQTARQTGAQTLVVAHQADDQVETVLMHMLRGAGSSGLKGMPYRSILPAFSEEIAVVRPLLGVWRSEILDYCRENRITPCYDRTNADILYFRNRIRQELIPTLKSYNPRADQHLWQLARIVESEDQYLHHLAIEALLHITVRQGGGYYILDRLSFSALDVVLQRRVVRLVFSILCNTLRDIGFKPVEDALSFLTDHSAHGEWLILDGMSLTALDNHQALLFTDQAELWDLWPMIEKDYAEELTWPAEYTLNPHWKICTTVQNWSETSLKKSENFVCFDLDLLNQPLSIGVGRTGERFLPFGMKGQSVKLGDFFTNNHYPGKARRQWPILRMGDQVLWLVGLRRSSIAAISETTRQVLTIELIREG